MHTFLAAFALSLFAAAPADAASSKRVQAITCPDKTERPRLDCSTDIGLKKKVVAANLKVPAIPIAFGGRYEEYAAGQITDVTYQHALSLERLCNEYNSCVISAEKYESESDNLRRLLEKHVNLATADADSQDGNALWANANGIAWDDQVRLTYQIEASQKANGATVMHNSGMVLKTGDKVRFHVQVQPEAHLYIVLHQSQGDVVQLFPDAATGRSNPLPARRAVVIPAPGQSFELDAVPGIETLYIMASKTPIQDMDDRMAAIESGAASDTSQLVTSITSILNKGPGKAQPDGWTTRGLKLTTEAAGTTFAAVPDDDVVVIRHRIEHD